MAPPVAAPAPRPPRKGPGADPLPWPLTPRQRLGARPQERIRLRVVKGVDARLANTVPAAPNQLHPLPLPVPQQRSLTGHGPLVKHRLVRLPHVQPPPGVTGRDADKPPLHNPARVVVRPNALAVPRPPEPLRLQPLEMDRDKPLLVQRPELQRHLVGPGHLPPLGHPPDKVL